MIANSIFKLGYVFFSTLFIGSVVFGLVAKLIAESSGKKLRVEWAFENIMAGDKLLTFPTVLSILVTAFLIDGSFPFPRVGFPYPWLLVAVFGYGLLLFIFVVAPLRKRIYLLVLHAPDDEILKSPIYKSLSKRWVFLGLAELIPPVMALLLSLAQL